MAQPPDLLEVRDVAKSYGAVRALVSADLTVSPGEIHALLGANGAGKSTLVKILSGALRPDSGTIAVAGREVRFSSPVDARRAGIAPVFQDPALVPHLSVADNFTLTGTDRAAVRPWLDRLELDVDLAERVNALPLALLRMLDLARALAHDPQLLLLDEMTAALPSDYADRVFAVMREWRDRGRSVLFISHRLTEVREICDRATVLRDGRAVDTHRTAEGSEARIVGAMLGERAARVDLPMAERGPAAVPGARPRLEVEELVAGRRLKGVSLSVAPGEVLGVVSLEGQGEDDLFLALAGDLRPKSGRVLVEGTPVRGRHPIQAIRRGITLVPSDRQHAVLPQRSIRENLALPLYSSMRSWGWISDRAERRAVDKAVEELEIDMRAAGQAKQLSGGNQQKLTIGRWLVGGYDVMLCFDPTRGIDVGTKHQIYRLLRQQAAEGRSVLMFTSELREVRIVCDRVVVLHDGRIVAEMPAAEADEERLLHAMHDLGPHDLGPHELGPHDLEPREAS
ncbi:MAG: sugar transporter ATP-binding protein [Blastococcus sp.]|jgi:ribose transport system ATP-binding protein|nr:sugar transporter ATP-binding protein [Blastococcus sp.]